MPSLTGDRCFRIYRDFPFLQRDKISFQDLMSAMNFSGILPASERRARPRAVSALRSRGLYFLAGGNLQPDPLFSGENSATLCLEVRRNGAPGEAGELRFGVVHLSDPPSAGLICAKSTLVIERSEAQGFHRQRPILFRKRQVFGSGTFLEDFVPFGFARFAPRLRFLSERSVCGFSDPVPSGTAALLRPNSFVSRRASRFRD